MRFIKHVGVRGVVEVCMGERHDGIVVECEVTLKPYGADPDIRLLRWHTDSGNREWDTWQPAETCPVAVDDADNELAERAEMAAFEACGDGGPRAVAEDTAACAGDAARDETTRRPTALHRGTITPQPIRSAVQRLVDEIGVRPTAREIGIDVHTVARLCSTAVGVYPGTIALAEAALVRLGRLEPEESS